MKNPAAIIAEAVEPIQALYGAAHKGGVPPATLGLVHLRASQINGCSCCVDSGWRSARKSGETHERLFAVAAWRQSPHFTDAERAALALTEAVTRLSDRADPVPDMVWDQAAGYYDEQGLAALLLMIAVTDVFNRLNVATRQVAGAWGESAHGAVRSRQRSDAVTGGTGRLDANAVRGLRARIPEGVIGSTDKEGRARTDRQGER